MSVQDLKAQIGEFSKDTRINLGRVLTTDGAPDLSPAQIAGIALACAYATREPDVIGAIEGEVSGQLGATQINAARSAATIMGMNNVYYRFVHLVSDDAYGRLPANLRMQSIASPGVDKVDFELYSLAVSAIAGCGMCIDSHVREVTRAGISTTGVQSAIRIASVINAAAQAVVIGKTARDVASAA